MTVPSGVVADHVKVQLLGGGPSVTAALTAGHAVVALPTYGSYGAGLVAGRPVPAEPVLPERD